MGLRLGRAYLGRQRRPLPSPPNKWGDPDDSTTKLPDISPHSPQVAHACPLRSIGPELKDRGETKGGEIS
jgi:hypothetical protein